jgi:hypothetical protein
MGTLAVRCAGSDEAEQRRGVLDMDASPGYG